MEKMNNQNHIVESVSKITDDELTLINQYTRRNFTKNELYVFSVVLCDNEVDRDNEYFSVSALEKMTHLFVGKTGITDHNPSAENQTARIFQCTLEKDTLKKTTYGDTYCRLVAKAYIPVNEHTTPIIEMIESGIRKEVSVGCAVDEIYCNICHTDSRNSHCEHKKGHVYGGKLCCHVLENVSDAYEWSFVAVPSQRMAGVMKHYLHQNKNVEVNVESFIQDLKKGKCQSVDSKNIKVLLDYISELEKYSQFGKVYYENLKKEYVRYNTLLFDDSEEDFFNEVAKRYTVEELETLVRIAKNRLENHQCANGQLFVENNSENGDNDDGYSI
ncbi:MAG: hypothetical protein IJU14_04660 [Clostridia bacterium]|nr:hypothetical protein [Clostridia bacterium]